MPNSPHSTPAPPPTPRFRYETPPVIRALDDVARHGMDSVAELGGLFQILVNLVDTRSAAYQVAKSGVSLANERFCAIDAARVFAKPQPKEQDRK